MTLFKAAEPLTKVLLIFYIYQQYSFYFTYI